MSLLGKILFATLLWIALPCGAKSVCEIRGEASQVTRIDLPNAIDPRLEEYTNSTPSVPDGQFHRPGTYHLGESYASYLSTIDAHCSVGGLSQCTAFLIFNKDTKKLLVHHSSMTLPKLENIEKLGMGQLTAVVISAVAFVDDADYLGRKNIPTDFLNITNATSHVQVRYDGDSREVVLSWKGTDQKLYLFRWKAFK